MLYGKIHGATVTDCKLNYNGSLGIDVDIMARAGLLKGQKVDVLNLNNGERFTTYAIEEPSGSKKFAIYGAAARKAEVGDKIIVIAYAHMSVEEARGFEAKLVFPE